MSAPHARSGTGNELGSWPKKKNSAIFPIEPLSLARNPLNLSRLSLVKIANSGHKEFASEIASLSETLVGILDRYSAHLDWLF